MSIADELITRGWSQGMMRDPTGRVCLMGAACAAYGIEWDSKLLPAEVLRALATAVDIDPDSPLFYGYDIAGWNDDEGRTFDEALRVAKEADEILGVS